MKSSLRWIIVLLACLAVCFSAQALVINVPLDQPTIQAGINASSPGDTVLVAEGTYYEQIDFLGKAISVTSISGPAFTTIDGGGAGNVVTFQSHEGRDTLLEGFTITNGTSGVYCTGTYPTTLTSPTLRNNLITANTSHGVDCYVSGALIENNVITGHTSAHYGAGIKVTGGTPEIRQNEITGNSSSTIGGGIYCTSANLLITQNIINNNTADHGGGIYCDPCNAVIAGNDISENTASYGSGFGDGGGLYVNGGYGTEIRDNLIAGNTAADHGGGLYADEYELLNLSGNRIINNDAYDGGGAYLLDRISYISNNLVANNTAQRDGGGFRFGHGQADLLNNTIISNQATHFGGGIFTSFTYVTLTNDILFFNSAVSDLCKEFYGAACQFSYCDVEGGQSSVYVLPIEGLTWGAGMIDADPLIIYELNSPACLSQTASGQVSDSPCLNAGSGLASAVSYETNVGTVKMSQMSTRTDQLADAGTVDLGWHNKGWPPNSVGAWLSSNPSTGTLPFTAQFTAGLINRYLAQTRKVAVTVDMTLASGQYFANWRSGFTNINRGETFTKTWPQYFPLLGTLVGVNQFSLTSVDVTPAPFNQPPYPPAGDTATGSCTVTGMAP